jgi:hypothetical protein
LETKAEVALSGMEPEMDVDMMEPRGTKRPIEEPEASRKPRKIKVSLANRFLRVVRLTS